MSHARAAVAALALTLPLAVVAAPAAAAPPPPVADPCGRTSWLAGTTELCSGALVYRDYVMDDYGAQVPLDPTSNTVLLGALSPTAGDARYPDSSRAGTADLVDLTLRIAGDRLVAVFELNALYEPGSTIAALAVDTDGSALTGTAQWDGVDDLPISGFEVARTATSGDVEANTITLEMPVPPGDRWRLAAVTAQGDGTVMNVAFRGIDETSNLDPADPLAQSTWWEDEQAAALAARDISAFTTTVDVADLRSGVTRRADQAAAGYHSRVFSSAHTIGSGEGYTYDPLPGRHGDTNNPCEQYFHSLGRYQPYSVYVPEELPPRPGLQLFLHGCNANHSSQIGSPGFQTQFGDELGRVIVAPLGRGPVGFYSDISEADVLEAVADADAVHRFDPDRQFMSGYSMGGYGAMRLAALYPDRWAGLTNWVGFTGDATNNPAGPSPTEFPSGAVGNVIDLLGNLEHIPSENLYAGADYLVQSSSALALGLRLREVGVDHRFYFHPAAEHLTFVVLDEWRKEADRSKGRSLVRNPPRVRFRTDAALAYPEYGLQHDRAYWTSQIRPVTAGYSDVDLTTAACGGSLPVRTAANNAGPSPVPWVSDELNPTGATPLQGDRLTGTLTNVASLVVDAAATCLTGKDVAYSLTTSGPATLRLTDGRVLALPAAGVHEGVLAASTARPAPGAAGAGAGQAPGADAPATRAAARARTLPATGVEAALPAAALVLLMGAAAVRRRQH